MTVGQAFDLAYRRFLERKGSQTATKQVSAMEEQIKAAEAEKEALKKKIEDLERAKNGTATNGQAQNQVRLPGESHNCSDRLCLPYILGVEIWHAQISLRQK